MGIFDALTTAVGGLQAQSYALQNISGNIANSQTTGFKETNTSFSDLVNEAALGQQLAGGVIASSQATNTVTGPIQSASVSTDMAINGDGYFVVAQPTSFSDNQPVFSGVNDFTRRGDFTMNSNGNLVNGAGYYLMGVPVDPDTGNPTGSEPEVLQFSNNFMPARATTSIQYQLNLPSDPTTADSNSSVASSNLLNPASFEANPLAGAPTQAEIIGTGASLSPDAAATATGNVSGGITTTTLLSTLGFSATDNTLTITDGNGNVTTYTYTSGDTVQTLITDINAGAANVQASVVNGQLQIQGKDDITNFTVTGNAASSLGYTAGTQYNPTNLLTQAVTQGQTMTFTDTTPSGASTTQTITFGTGAGQVATMAELSTALGALTNVQASVNPTNGDITVTALNNTDTITIGGTASASKFGIQNLTGYPANGTVIGNDITTFTNESIAGGSVTAYDATGNSVNVEFRWAKINSVATGGTDQWQLFYQTNSNATGTESAWQNVGTTFTFNSNGQLSPAIDSLTLKNLTVNGDSLGDVQLQFGSGGLTQFADASGTAQTNNLQQNGYAAGKLQSVAVDSENRITGTFSNGETIPLADISLATFNGQDALQQLDGEAYAATDDSGAPIYSATGNVEGSSLEGSNVDIATQFSQLIVAQQAYSANARVMTVADQMIQSLLTVIQ